VTVHLPFGPRPLVAVDLGTANTKVYVHGRGIVLFEPSVIAIDETSGGVLAVGDDARVMIGRTPSTIRASRPLRSGVITDMDVTEQMLRLFLEKAGKKRFAPPRVMLCVPGGVTTVERRAVEEATLAAGCSAVYLIEEAMAAAVGADLPVAEASAQMIVDVGGGTSEVAVISLGGMVVSRSLRVGGYDMDDAIVRMVRQRHNLSIGEETAERAKLAIGSAAPVCDDEVFEVRGREGMSGMLRAAQITGAEVREALALPVQRIVMTIVSALDETPPELSADLVSNGVVLAGGGCLLRGFAERIHEHTNLDVRLAPEPLMCVALGAGRSLEELDSLPSRSRRSWDRA
jgi:rod shape-determining protein MreB